MWTNCAGCCWQLVVALVLTAGAHVVSATELRIATYNINADTGGLAGSQSGPGLTTVLQAIGSEQLNGHAQPIDVLALQELYGTPATTLQLE